MPRHPRTLIEGYPHHVVQRGHDRQPVFCTATDFELYLANLAEQLQEREVALLSYCLMPNHVHLLLRPERRGADLSDLMRVVAARQTRHTNRVLERSGTLWERRFHSSIVDSDRYLLACCRYIELNPVRGRIVGSPADYPWSSYRRRVGLTAPAPGCPLAPLDAFDHGGPAAQAAAYRDFVAADIPPGELTTIGEAVHRNQLTGEAPFRGTVESLLGRRISVRAPGRPRRTG